MRRPVSIPMLLVLLGCGIAHAGEDRPQLTIRNHRFAPTELHIPAHVPVVIDVRNEDATAEEFDSADLGVEKVIAGGRQSPIRIRPLAPGRYKFIGEYHADTAAGTIVVEGAD